MTKLELWHRYRKYLYTNRTLGFSLDLSRMTFSEQFFEEMHPQIEKAFAQMEALEGGAIANLAENRMVGHYWLRNPEIAPTPEIASMIQATLTDIETFTQAVHKAQIKPPQAPQFKIGLVVGIGGSVLGPKFVHQMLSQVEDPMDLQFFDNTDPDGMDRVLSQIGDRLKETLVIVISKSGGTKETRNGMLEAKHAYEKAGLPFAQHAVAITEARSQLYQLAQKEGWIRTFPMWDWVGGRTSEMSAVGLLPAALHGVNIQEMLRGAREMDIATRNKDVMQNPAALLALMWYYIGAGKGKKDMVILPYKDRLERLTRYLQQLIMESLGKEHDLDGKLVEQGIVVYGNKGSTDQHAYVQQLREGLPNSFVTFVQILQDRHGASIEVEPGVTSGDYLHGFLLGTRDALYEKHRESMTITFLELNAMTIGALTALYERAVGLYAFLININAYHQPGVEAGKKAATFLINLQLKVAKFLSDNKDRAWSLEEIAAGIQQPEDLEYIYKILEHLAYNPDRGIQCHPGSSPFSAKFQKV